MSSNWGIVKSLSKVVGMNNKNKDNDVKDSSSSSSKTPKRPSVPGRSSTGPRLSASSVMLAGVKDFESNNNKNNNNNNNNNYNNNNYMGNKSNPLRARMNDDISINDISVSIKSVSPSIKRDNTSEKFKNNNKGSELNLIQDSSIVMKEVTVISGSVGSELVGLRISIFNQRNQQWDDGIIISFNADRHRICFDNGTTDDYYLPTSRIKLEELGANLISSGKNKRSSIIKGENKSESKQIVSNNEMNSIKKLIEARKSISIAATSINSDKPIADIDININNNTKSNSISIENTNNNINDTKSNTSQSLKRGSIIVAPESKENNNDNNNNTNDKKERDRLKVIENSNTSLIPKSSMNINTSVPFSSKKNKKSIIITSEEVYGDDDDDDENNIISSQIPFRNTTAADIPPPPPPPTTTTTTTSTSTTTTTTSTTAASPTIENTEISKSEKDYLFSLEVNTKNGQEMIYFQDGDDPDIVASSFVKLHSLPDKFIKNISILLREKQLEVLKSVLSSSSSSTIDTSKEPVSVLNDEVEQVINIAPSITEPDVPKTIEDVSESNIISNDICSKESESDWVEIVDEQQGYKYYYNQTTGETSWNNPKDNEQTEKTSKWIEVNDEQHGKYYYNQETGETSWNNPNDNEQQKTTSSSEWIEVNDEQQGKYYYNQTTGETSWNNPNDNEQQKTTSSEWIEVNDEQQGYKYYYNQTTGETSWNSPVV